jgi:rhamnose transport system substrate-binding protein
MATGTTACGIEVPEIELTARLGPTPTSRASSRRPPVGIAAAARYLSGSQYKGKVALTGLGTPNQTRSFVKDGTVKAFALWNPADFGYLAAYAGAALASGQITGNQGAD